MTSGEVGSKEGYGDVEADGGIRAGVVGVGWRCWIWVEG
jgi:hypothetical protein